MSRQISKMNTFITKYQDNAYKINLTGEGVLYDNRTKFKVTYRRPIKPE